MISAISPSASPVRARKCPWQRWLEETHDPRPRRCSMIATASASWPMHACVVPLSKPRSNSSSRLSSKRRMNRIRRYSRSTRGSPDTPTRRAVRPVRDRNGDVCIGYHVATALPCLVPDTPFIVRGSTPNIAQYVEHDARTEAVQLYGQFPHVRQAPADGALLLDGADDEQEATSARRRSAWRPSPLPQAPGLPHRRSGRSTLPTRVSAWLPSSRVPRGRWRPHHRCAAGRRRIPRGRAGGAVADGWQRCWRSARPG